MDKTCNFCRKLSEQIKATEGKRMHAYEAGLTRLSWKAEEGREKAATLSWGGYKLNFCPECGRKIES